MPVHNVQPHDSRATPADLLFERGLLLQVQISVPSSLGKIESVKNQRTPSPQSGSALVDTGASCCCVEDAVLRQLNLQPIRETPMSGATGNRTLNVYHARLTFPGTPMAPIEMDVVGVHMNQPGIICLFGRDILRYCVLIYNGPQGSYTIAF
jgi:hypothetical protein